MTNPCNTFWGSHGCCVQPDGTIGLSLGVAGHPGPHMCDCCECGDHERDHEESGCVAKPPYYGPQTWFYH